MQHERDPPGRLQSVEHDGQRAPDRVEQHRLLLGVDPTVGVVPCHYLVALGVLPACLAGARCEPAAEVAHLVGVGAVEPQPALRRDDRADPSIR